MSLNINYKIKCYTSIKTESFIMEYSSNKFAENLDKLISDIIKKAENQENVEVYDFNIAIDADNNYHIIIKYKKYEN